MNIIMFMWHLLNYLGHIVLPHDYRIGILGETDFMVITPEKCFIVSANSPAHKDAWVQVPHIHNHTYLNTITLFVMILGPISPQSLVASFCHDHCL